ncbi:MAG: polyhydroxyalkanoate synthesis repressor PhaR [Chromatiaceae bacterium]|nr:MAG: polyhydroxyalkanoate synthesis repressor PhaR [Chromatiaceae bacterium]
MATERIIKKYPNRRLYDTELSRYITLADVRDLVMAGAPFRVLDTANDADITRSILLQIMLEEEAAGGEPLFTAGMLAQIIRFYGGTLQGLFTRYLEHSLDTFAEQQRQLTEAWGKNPFEVMGRLTQRNIEIWLRAQKQFLRATGFDLPEDEVVAANGPAATESPDNPKNASTGEAAVSSNTNPASPDSGIAAVASTQSACANPPTDALDTPAANPDDSATWIGDRAAAGKR